MQQRISLVVCAYNEEHNIGDCIRSAQGLVAEAVVVDMSSSDGTVAAASSLGARVQVVPKVPFVDPTRNYAISLASGDWILMIDADERLSPALAGELRAIADGNLADVVESVSDVYMFGRSIRYSGWQDVNKAIFFKKGFLTYPGTVVHSHPLKKGRKLSLDRSKGVLLHYNYKNIRHFVSKMNDYTDGEALKLLEAGGSPSPLRGAYWGMRHFLRRYALRFGYKDGAYGFMLCGLMGIYWFLAFCKAWEMRLAVKTPGPGVKGAEKT
jgi:glycosyltransferase involved in cell wall biosynthesis